MRMTAATVYRDATAAMEQASERLVEFQKQVETGKRITKPSDDPDGMAAHAYRQLAKEVLSNANR